MAFTTAKMGLKIWNLLTDLYDHTQIADNWAKVDYHDHSPGKGVQIPTDGIADGAITATKLAASTDPTGAFAGSKLIVAVGGSWSAGATTGLWMLNKQYAVAQAVAAVGSGIGSPFYADPSDWAAPAKTVRYQLRGHLITNATAPGASTVYTFGLYPVATWGGAASASPTVATLGSVVAGSTVAVSNPPAATALSVAVDFVAPSAGFYVLGVNLSGSAAAGTAMPTAHATLSAKQV